MSYTEIDMNPQTTKVKNGTIVLPERLRRIWEGVDVLITPERDKIVIEKRERRIFSKETEEKLRVLGRKITKKDIQAAVDWARGKS